MVSKNISHYSNQVKSQYFLPSSKFSKFYLTSIILKKLNIIIFQDQDQVIIHQIVQLDMEHLALSGLSQIQEMENAWRLKSYQTSSKAWSAPNVSFVSSKWCVSSSTITYSLAWISYRYTCQDDHCHIWKKKTLYSALKSVKKLLKSLFTKKECVQKKSSIWIRL